MRYGCHRRPAARRSRAAAYVRPAATGRTPRAGLRPISRWISCVRARLLALGGFAIAAGVGGARQHAVLGGEPALALALEEARHLLFETGGAQHLGVAEFDQHRAFGMPRVATRDADVAQLVGAAAARAGTGGGNDVHGRSYLALVFLDRGPDLPDRALDLFFGEVALGRALVHPGDDRRGEGPVGQRQRRQHLVVAVAFPVQGDGGGVVGAAALALDRAVDQHRHGRR